MSTGTQSERARLLEAMLEELVDKGYSGAEVEGAMARAQLDDEGWSELFADKDACVLAAVEQLAVQARATVCDGCGRAGDWVDRVAGGLRALLVLLAGQAAIAEELARSLPAIGPTGQRLYQAFVEGLGALLAEGREVAGAGAELPAEVELLAVGAAEAILFEEVRAGRTEGLPRLAPEILFSLLVPFLGPVAAAAEMEKERQGSGRLEPA